MAVRTIVALFLCGCLGAQDPQIPEDAWKAGVPVPPGAVAVVGGAAGPVDVFVDEMAARHVRADSAVGPRDAREPHRRDARVERGRTGAM